MQAYTELFIQFQLKKPAERKRIQNILTQQSSIMNFNVYTPHVLGMDRCDHVTTSYDFARVFDLRV